MKDQIVGKAERAYGKAEQLVNNLKDSELEQVNLASPEENKNLLSYFLFMALTFPLVTYFHSQT